VNKLLATIAGVALTVLPAASFATTTTGNVTVNATVNAACTLSTSNPLAFPAYDPSALVGLTASAAESIQCTNTTVWTLSVPASYVIPGPAGPPLTATGINTVPATATSAGLPQSFNVNGSLAPGQYASPGAYSGSITVTASF
jgi:spore coat protein U-like protein